MDFDLLNKLIYLTDKSPSFLIRYNGRQDAPLTNTVMQSRRLLTREKFFSVRSDTNPNPFPEHTHDYVEIVFMYKGSKTNIVNGETVILNQGDILFLSQNCRHENLASTTYDAAVNFIVLPQFFERVLELLGSEETMIHRFIVDCLHGKNGKSSYLHFKTGEIQPICNLVDNLIWNYVYNTPNQYSIAETTMGLLLLQLLNHTDSINYNGDETNLIFNVLNYIETHFADGSLRELSELLYYDFNTLSRRIKKLSGKNYTELVQEKRLSQACVLLTTTNFDIAKISQLIGYENISYFHKLFKNAYGISPKKYRTQAQKQDFECK